MRHRKQLKIGKRFWAATRKHLGTTRWQKGSAYATCLIRAPLQQLKQYVVLQIAILSHSFMIYQLKLCPFTSDPVFFVYCVIYFLNLQDFDFEIN